MKRPFACRPSAAVKKGLCIIYHRSIEDYERLFSELNDKGTSYVDSALEWLAQYMVDEISEEVSLTPEVGEWLP